MILALQPAVVLCSLVCLQDSTHPTAVSDEWSGKGLSYYIRAQAFEYFLLGTMNQATTLEKTSASAS